MTLTLTPATAKAPRPCNGQCYCPRPCAPQVCIADLLKPDGSVVIAGATYRYDGDQWVVEL